MCDPGAKTHLPWSNGCYKSSRGDQVVGYVRINGTTGDGALTFLELEEKKNFELDISIGEFDHPDKRGLEVTDKERYSVKVVVGGEFKKEIFANVEEDGKRWTFMNGNTWILLDKDDINQLKHDIDPADEMPNDYKPMPNNLGKIIWITGGTGMGKTTTGMYLKESHGFVYYEGDCFLFGVNPYVGSAPKGQSYFGTRPLSGISDDRKAACKRAFKEGYGKLLNGEEAPFQVWEDVYTLMVQEIQRERSRLGGDWVISQAVYTRAARDFIRTLLGPCLRFVALEMDRELQAKRLTKREEGTKEQTEEAKEKMMERRKGWCQGYEPAEIGEPNTQRLQIKEGMTPKDVANEILMFSKH